MPPAARDHPHQSAPLKTKNPPVERILPIQDNVTSMLSDSHETKFLQGADRLLPQNPV